MALEKNRVYQGDCVDLLGRADEESVELVFADPPFNIGYDYDEYDDAKHADEYLSWCRRWIQGIHRVLKSNGTFWLAIGDEYAAELKMEAQKAGFHCRSWVIWYYTFGVNCRNGFSRSHTHLFHFVKDRKDFVFNRVNPQIRIRSARQLVYADGRANPDGRLPDNTWIIRPQDAPLSFSPVHDTWYFARVAGTFKEREGFHGCQMPEQLLARIILASSRPLDLVLDPFGGSGTTMCVAKKLGRQWLGFELSADYVQSINKRLEKTHVGDPVDGPEDPIQSAPSTANGKQRKQRFDGEIERIVIDAYQQVGQGYPTDYLLCNKELNDEFIAECSKRGVRGSAFVWNHYLPHLRKAGRLPRSTRRPPLLTSEQLNRFGYAAEVAWRLLALDYRKTLDDILCSPDFVAEFDRLAADFGPRHISVTSCEFRRAAVAVRKRAGQARETAAANYRDWSSKSFRRVSIVDYQDAPLDVSGVFAICHDNTAIYAYESDNIREQLTIMLDNPRWQRVEPDSILYQQTRDRFVTRYARKAALVRREYPILNCPLWVTETELPDYRVASRVDRKRRSRVVSTADGTRTLF